jgi:hypothetical protein
MMQATRARMGGMAASEVADNPLVSAAFQYRGSHRSVLIAIIALLGAFVSRSAAPWPPRRLGSMHSDREETSQHS